MDTKKTRLHEIGLAIARERERQGLTQSQLSSMIGLTSHSHLSRVECGKKAPSLVMLFNVADALNVNVNYFFTKL